MLISGVTLPSRRSSRGDLVGDQLAVGEDLEVAVRVRGEDVQQLRVHERLAAEDAEVAVAVLLGVADDPVQLVERRSSVAGASTSTQQPWQRSWQLLMIEMNRNGGKWSPALEPRLELLDRAHRP